MYTHAHWQIEILGLTLYFSKTFCGTSKIAITIAKCEIVLWIILFHHTTKSFHSVPTDFVLENKWVRASWQWIIPRPFGTISWGPSTMYRQTAYFRLRKRYPFQSSSSSHTTALKRLWISRYVWLDDFYFIHKKNGKVGRCRNVRGAPRPIKLSAIWLTLSIKALRSQIYKHTYCTFTSEVGCKPLCSDVRNIRPFAISLWASRCLWLWDVLICVFVCWMTVCICVEKMRCSTTARNIYTLSITVIIDISIEKLDRNMELLIYN